MTCKEAIKLIQEIEEDGRNVTTEHIEALNFAIDRLIDKAPTIETIKIEHKAYNEGFKDGVEQGIRLSYRPQGEYVDISKLRLMTVEECAGHTVGYAMGWKACIEWIKKGCPERR